MSDRFAPADAAGRRERYASLAAKLKLERASFDAHWRDIADFLQPRRTRWQPSDRNKGDKRDQRIIDSTGRYAHRTLASGMHAGLTSPARPWFKLTVADPDLRNHPNVKAWLYQSTQRMSALFLSSNLYTALPTVYGDMGTFGTGCMAILEDAKKKLRAYTFPIGSYALGSDNRGMLSTFVHETERTVEQIVEEFGVLEDGTIDWSNISTVVKRAWDRSDYQQAVRINWIITPNADHDPRLLGRRRFPFSSCHFETDTNEGKFLKERGYYEMPILAPRWDATLGDDYGTDSCGMTVLSDVKQLQIEQKKKGQAIAKLVDPPLIGPAALRAQKTSLVAGDITYLDDPTGKALRPIHEIGLNLQHLTLDIADVRDMINRGYYVDLFLMLASSNRVQPITAREVEERHEEKLLVLGPVLERTNDEMLDPLIERTYAIMDRAGDIPQVPQELDGVEFGVQYLSVMAQAQQLVGVVGLDRFTQTILNVASVAPGVVRKIRTNKLVDEYAQLLGVNPEIIATDEDADAGAQADAQQQQQLAAAQQAQLMGRAIKDTGTTPMQDDTALARLAAAVTG